MYTCHIFAHTPLQLIMIYDFYCIQNNYDLHRDQDCVPGTGKLDGAKLLMRLLYTLRPNQCNLELF